MNSTILWQASPSKNGSFLPIVYEDENLIILHKTSGIPSLPHDPQETETAVGSALAHLPSLTEVGNDPREPGLIHRLDTGTSGLLVFTKTNSEFTRLREEWKARNVKKYYRAWAAALNPLPKLPLLLDSPLGHDAKSSKKMRIPSRKSSIRGKPLPAKTCILKCHQMGHREGPDPLRRDSIVDLEIQIETGVMHQIRCHLASMKYPLLGDPLYKGPTASRLWLHAWRLQIPMRKGSSLILEATLPENWNSPS